MGAKWLANQKGQLQVGHHRCIHHRIIHMACVVRTVRQEPLSPGNTLFAPALHSVRMADWPMAMAVPCRTLLQPKPITNSQVTHVVLLPHVLVRVPDHLRHRQVAVWPRLLGGGHVRRAVSADQQPRSTATVNPGQRLGKGKKGTVQRFNCMWRAEACTRVAARPRGQQPRSTVSVNHGQRLGVTKQFYA